MALAICYYRPVDSRLRGNDKGDGNGGGSGDRGNRRGGKEMGGRGPASGRDRPHSGPSDCLGCPQHFLDGAGHAVVAPEHRAGDAIVELVQSQPVDYVLERHIAHVAD